MKQNLAKKRLAAAGPEWDARSQARLSALESP